MLSTWRRFLSKPHEHGSDSEDSKEHAPSEIEMDMSRSFGDCRSFSMEDMEEDTTGPAQPQQYKYTSASPNGLVHRRAKHHDDSEHKDDNGDYDFSPRHNHLNLNLNKSPSQSQSQSLSPRFRRHRHKHKNLYIKYCLLLVSDKDYPKLLKLFNGQE